MTVRKINTKFLFLTLLIVCFALFNMKAQSNKNVPVKKTYTIGFTKNLFNQVDLRDAQAAMKIWLAEIVKTYDYSDEYILKTKLYDNFDDLSRDMKRDSLAILALDTYEYLSYNKVGLEPMLVPSAEGDIFAQYYVLVRKNSRYKSIKDLKGASIGLLSGQNHAASRLWLDVTLAKDNIPDKSKFFQNITSVTKESQLILNLFFGLIDACIVSKGSFSVMKELNPQVGENIVCIQTSPKYLWGVVCYTKTFVNERDRGLFYTSAIHVHELISGKQLFSLIRIDKLSPFSDECFDTYKDLLKEYNSLLKAKKLKKDEFN